MATTAQDIAALKRALKDLQDRVEALEGAQPRIEQAIREHQSSNDVMFKVVLRQLEDIRLVGDQRQAIADQRQVIADQRQVIADQRHAEIMGQFEKILTQPREN